QRAPSPPATNESAPASITSAVSVYACPGATVTLAARAARPATTAPKRAPRTASFRDTGNDMDWLARESNVKNAVAPDPSVAPRSTSRQVAVVRDHGRRQERPQRPSGDGDGP